MPEINPTTLATFSTTPGPVVPMPAVMAPAAAPLSRTPGEVIETSEAAIKLAQLAVGLTTGAPLQVLGTQPNRKYVLIVNSGAGDVLLGFDLIPRPGLGIPLVASQSYLLTNPSCSNAIFALAPTADSQLQVLWG